MSLQKLLAELTIRTFSVFSPLLKQATEFVLASPCSRGEGAGRVGAVLEADVVFDEEEEEEEEEEITGGHLVWRSQ
jgi:hypothetical protein